MSILDDLKNNADEVAEGYGFLRYMIQGSWAGGKAIFPKRITEIGNYAFFRSLISEAEIPSTVTYIGQGAFQYTEFLRKALIPHGCSIIGNYAFYSSTIETITIPNTVNEIGKLVFLDCSRLQYVTIENGFNCNNLNLSDSTLYSAETIVSWLNALADRTGDTAYTLTIGFTNLAKLTAEQIAIATNKNWNLA